MTPPDYDDSYAGDTVPPQPTAPATPSTFFPDYDWSGPNVAPKLQEVLQRVKVEADKLTHPNKFRLDLPVMYRCETKIAAPAGLRNVQIFSSTGTGGTIRLTPTPDQVKELAARGDRVTFDFEIWSFTEGRNIKFGPQVQIVGPKPRTAGRSPGAVVEHQHGIHLGGVGWDITDEQHEAGEYGAEICLPYIERVWGDGVSFGTTALRPKERYCKHVSVLFANILYPGRCGFVTNGVNWLTAQGCTIDNPGSSDVDMEAGNAFDELHHHRFLKNTLTGTRERINFHFHGGSPLRDVDIVENLRDNGFLFIVAVAPSNSPGGDPRSHDRHNVLSNIWELPQAPGARVSNWWRADTLRIQYNRGPYRPTGIGVFDTSHDCVNVTKVPNYTTTV